MKYKILSVIICCSLLWGSLSLISCSKEKPSTQSILNHLIKNEVSLPSGRVYLSTAPEGSDFYVSDSLLSALYGGGSTPIESKLWIEYSIFLSTTAHPCEFAVFLCTDTNGASDTAKMLCRRLDILKSAWLDSEYSAYVESAEITVLKNYCIFTISSDSKAQKKQICSFIG